MELTKFEKMLKEEPEILGVMLLMMWVEDDLLTEDDASAVVNVLEVDEMVRVLNAEKGMESEWVFEALISLGTTGHPQQCGPAGS